MRFGGNITHAENTDQRKRVSGLYQRNKQRSQPTSQKTQSPSANVPSSLIKPTMAKNNFEFNNLTNLRKPGNVIISNCLYNRLQQEE